MANDMDAASTAGLTEDQKTFFHREGYLVLPALLSHADLQPAIEDVERAVEDKAAELVAAGKLSRDYAELGFEHRLAGISRETDKVALSLWNGVLHGPGFYELITNRKLLDVAESLCGEALIASSVYRLRPKIPHYSYGAVPWHQDSAYFEPYCDHGLVLTMWIPLVDTDAGNGCLWVIPRAHTGAVVPHCPADGKAYLQIAEADLPAGDPVCCPIPKGGILLLHNRAPHGSFENQTDAVRWSMDLRYQSAALPTNASITRLPGESTPHGKTIDDPDFVPVACHPPEADFLVRSTTRPNEVLHTAEQFAQLRARHVPTPSTDRWGAWWEGEANRPTAE